MKIKIPGELISYYNRERGQYNDAMGQYGQPSAEELALMEEQVKAVEQAMADRKATLPLVLGQMGLKLGTGPDGKMTFVPLSNDERRDLMSKADQYKSDAAAAYQGRAKAAASGTTKLPSFLRKDVDLQKSKEEALLGELLGPEALNSTAGKQAVEGMRKKEEEIRQKIQEQDLASAPGASMSLSGQLADKRRRTIGGYEALPKQGANLIAGRGSLLNQMQQVRLDALKKRLAELESKRQGITSMFTLGGTVGGSAVAAANQRKSSPQVQSTSYPTSYGASYDTGWGDDTAGLGTSYNTADWVYGR